MKELFAVDVGYRRAEYVEIVREAIQRQMAEEQGAAYAEPNAGSGEGALARMFSNFVLSLALFYKRLRLGTCRFAFSEQALTRTSRAGVKTVAWSDVLRVRRFSSAYLIEVAAGGLPLPYRCLDASQRAAFDALLAHKGFSAS